MLTPAMQTDDVEDAPDEAAPTAPLKPKAAQQRAQVGGIVRWIAGRLLSMGIDWRNNIGLNDERIGLRPPVMRMAIDWRRLVAEPGAKSEAGLRREVVREVCMLFLLATDELRHRGADPDMPAWRARYADNYDKALDAFEAFFNDSEDPDDYWIGFLREFDAAYRQLEQQKLQRYIDKYGVPPANA